MNYPDATYRLQLNKDCTLSDVRGIIEYLRDMGISDIYASPIFEKRKGSTHGYDVLDPREIDSEIGTLAELTELRGKMKELPLGWIQDIVPNHMAYDSSNNLLMDVFEKGGRSKFFNYFDIEWERDPSHPSVMAPFLGRHYGTVLEDGQFRLALDEDGFNVGLPGWTFPLRIDSYSTILDMVASKLPEGESKVKVGALSSTVRSLEGSVWSEEVDHKVADVKKEIVRIHKEDPVGGRALDEVLALINGKKGVPESFDALDDLLREQYYRPSVWTLTNDEIDYRRFFTIGDLIGLRMERDDVFERFHSILFYLVGSGIATGIRIDHIDGLLDPWEYLQRVRDKAKDAYIMVEKILARSERMQPDWPVQGTTGYDYLNMINGLFVDPSGEEPLDRIYREFTGMKVSFSEVVRESKRMIADRRMRGELDNLSALLKNLARSDRQGYDLSLRGLRVALMEYCSNLSVYRTYTDRTGVREQDKGYIMGALERSVEHLPELSRELGFLGRVLLGKIPSGIPLALRIQQLTGPLMAKGSEDTAFYLYNRLVSLNEVGGDPGTFSTPVAEFHEFALRRKPGTMNATSTHDTKRGEDVRMRIDSLSEMTQEWERTVISWREMNRPAKGNQEKGEIPSANDEYLLYQSMVGALPFDEGDLAAFGSRLKAYMMKAAREAKVRSAWGDPDKEYEDGTAAFIDRCLDQNGKFLSSLIEFGSLVSKHGVIRSLSQTMIKIASPGFPDFYMGSELWDLNLVDPDNRRKVDFKRRIGMMKANSPPRISISDPSTGAVKLGVMRKCLLARCEHRDLFRDGSYFPLDIEGELASDYIAFARQREDEWAVLVCPIRTKRLLSGCDISGTSVILPKEAPREWREAVTDITITAEGKLRLDSFAREFPMGLLTGGERR